MKIELGRFYTEIGNRLRIKGQEQFCEKIAQEMVLMGHLYGINLIESIHLLELNHPLLGLQQLKLLR